MISELLQLEARAEGPKYYIAVSDLLDYLQGVLTIGELSVTRKTSKEITFICQQIEMAQGMQNIYDRGLR